MLEWYLQCLTILSLFPIVLGQQGKCDQTPPLTSVLTPTEDKGLYYLTVENNEPKNGKVLYIPDQTYVLIIKAANIRHPFRWFMITAEDPAMDHNVFDSYGSSEVGSLKTLGTDSRSRHSERCYNSVESSDYSDKTSVEIHWVSPKQRADRNDENKIIRIRATVTENSEIWYEGSNLTLELHKNNQKPRDTPPNEPLDHCNLCSEARYEVIFWGKWSRVTHPRFYPGKPDENGYTHMVGASHSPNSPLWQPGSKASEGLKNLVENYDPKELEQEIIANMSETEGTRTLIRGKRRHHPYMMEPSHSLFRVDRFHHMFSLVVGLRPSPDWFLGTYRFELCTESGWYKEGEIPLYPWDAGTMDGVSYESPRSKTQVTGSVERVEVGSFNEDSPFFQMNLNDLKEFAKLQVRLLDVYTLSDEECSNEQEVEGMSAIEEAGEEEPQAESVLGEDNQEEMEEPVLSESRQKLEAVDTCQPGEWGEWSDCEPVRGDCGSGFQTRIRRKNLYETYEYQSDVQQNQDRRDCEGDDEIPLVQYQDCFVDC